MNEIKIDRLVRSKRKTIALILSEEAQLIVRAPQKTPLEYIQKLISQKKIWIQKKQQQILKRGGAAKEMKFENGEKFLFLGEAYSLRIENCWEIELEKDLLFPQRFLAKAKAKMILWYKERAFEKLTERAKIYSEISGWKYKTISITSARRRWGSCSSTNSLHFTWRLVMAPQEVIDYVVVHELAHIAEKNHSVRFWNQVKSILPNYETSQRWLKENGKILTV